MRNLLWTSLIGLVTGSILVAGGFPRIAIEKATGLDQHSSAVEPVVEIAFENVAPRAADRAEAGSARDRQAGRNVEAREVDPAVSVDPVLDATPKEDIRRMLVEAIQTARQTRPLDVHPAILDRVIRDDRVRVVFDIDPTSSPNALATRLADIRSRAAVEELRFFPLFSHGAARLDAEALLVLIRSGATSSIELDGLHRASLLESVPRIGADRAHALEFDGDGTTIAILDTGVEGSHPFFADRLVDEACFSLLNQCPNASSRMLGPGSAIPCAHRDCAHGTHVTGIALGRDPAGSLVGVAPNANLIAIQIFSEVDGEIGAYSSDILAALHHILGLAPFYPIASVNFSLGGDAFTSEAACDQAAPSQRLAVALLQNVGIATVAASGNDGLGNAISSPACLSNVIGVGSTNDADTVSSFTNSAAFLSVLAPGESIESAGLGGVTRYSSGTSMAAPHVTGAIAAIREAHPTATVGEIENAILLSGVPVLDGRNGETHPRLDVQAAIDLLIASASPPPVAGDAPIDRDDSSAAPAAARAASPLYS